MIHEHNGIVNTEHEEHLEHYGVKGMKWGVRRPRGSDGRVKGGKKAAESSDRKNLKKTQAKSKKSGVGSLTNNEIQKATQRINLEQRYSALNPSRGQRVLSAVKTGTGVASTILAVGTAANKAIEFSNSPAGQMIKQRLSG